jgi:GTPase
VLIDATVAFSATDMTLIKKIIDEGRGVVVVANKWDMVQDKFKKKAVKWMDKQLEKGLGQAKGIPIAYISAKTGHRSDRIMDEVLRVYEKWNTRVSTGLLNKWIHAFSKVQKLPATDGKMLKMRYLMQIKVRPPTFFLYVNNKKLMTDNFEHFVRNSISKEFGFMGVPIRVLIRDSRTQYAKKKLS